MSNGTVNQATHPDHFELLNFYREQMKIQREIMDRWFAYFLLIIGAPFPILGGLLQVDKISSSITKNVGTFVFLAFLFFVIGLIFLFMNIRQRINTIRFLDRILPIEEALYKELFPEVEFKKYPKEHYGADFYIGLVHIVINVAWFTAALFLLGLNWNGCKRLLWIYGIPVILVSQLLMREIMLEHHKKSSGNK